MFSRRLAKNILSGFGMQLVLAVATIIGIPLLVRGLGKSSYGIYSLAVVVVGYASVLDVGIGPSLVRYVSAAVARGDRSDALRAIRAALAVSPVLGMAVGIALFLSAPMLVSRVFQVPSGQRHAAELALQIMAAGFFVMFVKGTLEAVSTGHQRVAEVNVVNTGGRVLQLAGGAVLASSGYGLVPVVGINVLVLALQTLGMFVLAAQTMGGARWLVPVWSMDATRHLVRYGILLSLASGAGQLLVTIDKLLVPILLPVTFLTFYAVSYDLANYLWQIPYPAMRAYYPAFGLLHGTADFERLRKHYVASTKLVSVATLLFAALMFVFGPDILTIWIGPGFAAGAASTFRVFVVGMVASCLFTVPQTLALAAGRAAGVVRASVLLIGLNAVLVVVLVRLVGLEGAAAAWAMTQLLFLAYLLWMIEKQVLAGCLPLVIREALARPAIVALATVGPLAFFARGHQGLGKVVVLSALSGSAYAIVAWLAVLSAEERATVLCAVRS